MTTTIRIDDQLLKETKQLAALAIESGSEWISTDGDYARFANLKWRHPLTSG